MGEKIDVIAWKDDPASLVRSALAPAEIESVEVVPETHTLKVLVADGQLALAIGKRGQNARLAAKLLGWKVDVRGRGEVLQTRQEELGEQIQPEGESAVMVVESSTGTDIPLAELPGIGEKLAGRLIEAGLDSCQKLADASEDALVQVDGVGPKTAQKLIETAKATLASRNVV